jgi:hypothetical protein
MDAQPTSFESGLSPEERNYIRRELDMVFSTLPTVADGFLLKVWATGPNKGRPKLPPAAQSLAARSFVTVDETQHPPRLMFTTSGREALRAMMASPRHADPVKFAHIRRELGIDPELQSEAAGAVTPSLID